MPVKHLSRPAHALIQRIGMILPPTLDFPTREEQNGPYRHDRAAGRGRESAVDWHDQLVVRRKKLGLRQVDLAELAGVSERFVRLLESGKPTVRLDKVEPVLAVLGLRLALVPVETP